MNCSKCKFMAHGIYKLTGKPDERMFCFRNPPQVLPGSPDGHWPEVSEWGHCGEFQPIEAPVEEKPAPKKRKP